MAPADTCCCRSSSQDCEKKSWEIQHDRTVAVVTTESSAPIGAQSMGPVEEWLRTDLPFGPVRSVADMPHGITTECQRYGRGEIREPALTLEANVRIHAGPAEEIGVSACRSNNYNPLKAFEQGHSSGVRPARNSTSIACDQDSNKSSRPTRLVPLSDKGNDCCR